MKSNKILLALFIFLIALSTYGCSNQSKVENSASDETVSISSETRIITDAAGREVTIPKTITSVAPLANALRMMCYADAVDLVVGVELAETESALLKAYSYVNHEYLSTLPVVGTGGSSGFTAYEEELVKLNPDVIICSYPVEDAENLQAKTGIPVIVINSGTLFEEDYNESLRIIGEVCHKEDRCEEVISFIQNAVTDLNNRTIDFPEENKPSVYVGALSYKGRHGIEGTYTNFPPLTAIHANDILSDEYTEIQAINVEKELILMEDPDVLFLDPVSLQLVNDDYASNPEYYQALSAYNNQEIYTMIGYNYYHTNVEIAIADSYYAGYVLYPEAFSDIDPEEKANEIFSFLLGSETYYQDLKNAGFGFGKLTIGE